MKPCVNCGTLTTGIRPYRDVCPTDRGSEIREGYEPYCGCDDDTGPDDDDREMGCLPNLGKCQFPPFLATHRLSQAPGVRITTKHTNRLVKSIRAILHNLKGTEQ